MHSFIKKIEDNTTNTQSHLCIGLDPDPKKLPTKFPESVAGVEAFLNEIIQETADLCVAYKPNISFFEALGLEGLHMLERVMKNIPDHVPTVLDAKRGDIGNTASMQAKYMFDYFGADATTINPLMGEDCVEPFLSYTSKFHFILGLTSNPGAALFEKQKMANQDYLYETIIKQCSVWNKTFKNVGCVVGATNNEMKHVRDIDRDLLFLVPGVGAQGGDYRQTSDQSKNKQGLTLINVSRGVLYISKDSDYLTHVRQTIINTYKH